LCSHNQISSIDLTQNTNLISLSCADNQLSNLDLTQNTNLTYAYCSINQIVHLYIAPNTSLETLYCGENQITNLDLSQSANLTILDCFENQLNTLNVKNGNNTNFIFFSASINPNLACIQVDNITYSANNWGAIDATSTFNTNCGFLSTIRTNSLEGLRAYPNPTTKNITLDFGKLYQETNIQITNLTGQNILNKSLQNSSNTTLELEGTAGVYFVRIQTEEGAATLKVIKE
jgi:hypothetical protein